MKIGDLVRLLGTHPLPTSGFSYNKEEPPPVGTVGLVVAPVLYTNAVQAGAGVWVQWAHRGAPRHHLNRDMELLNESRRFGYVVNVCTVFGTDVEMEAKGVDPQATSCGFGCED